MECKIDAYDKKADGAMNTPGVNPQLKIRADRLSHAYITGGRLAETLAMAAVCSGHGDEKPCMICSSCSKASRRIHPDIAFVDKPPDKREIIVDQIRRLKKDVIVVPTESTRKVYIINNADLMNINAQNAFLQILEEPPGHAVFILNTETPALLLPTVRSRCVEINNKHDNEAPDPAAAELAERFFSAVEIGGAAIAGFMFQLEKLDKDAFRGFLTAAREQAVNKMRPGAGAVPKVPRRITAGIEQTLGKAGEMLDLNVNAGHISGFICATLIDIK